MVDQGRRLVLVGVGELRAVGDEGGRLVLLPAQGRGGADSRLWGDDLMLTLLPLYLSVQLLLHLLVVILLLIGDNFCFWRTFQKPGKSAREGFLRTLNYLQISSL